MGNPQGEQTQGAQKQPKPASLSKAACSPLCDFGSPHQSCRQGGGGVGGEGWWGVVGGEGGVCEGVR